MGIGLSRWFSFPRMLNYAGDPLMNRNNAWYQMYAPGDTVLEQLEAEARKARKWL